MAGLREVPGPSRKPTLPLLLPPWRQNLLDARWTPISGATTSAFLAGTTQPPWMQTNKEVRQRMADERTDDGLRPPPNNRLLNRPTPFVPPPHPGAFGSHKSVARHAYGWGRDTTMAAHFRPDNHTVMINGRPMQAEKKNQQDIQI